MVAFSALRRRLMSGRLPRVDASPFYKLPNPPTKPELIAAAMISEAHLKVSVSPGVDLGGRLIDCLYWCDEPEMRAMRLAEGGPGDPPSWGDRRSHGASRKGGGSAARPCRRLQGRITQARSRPPCPTCARPFEPGAQHRRRRRHLKRPIGAVQGGQDWRNRIGWGNVARRDLAVLEHFPLRLHRIPRRRDSWRILVV